ncbi:hypothetical protein, conserved [Eimeria necatrix]|uniref:Uncharacterized protein n=1 Tax=Eimeria necatrix TaxID=51315 RepID=U6MXP1_9EIME|nr:hypothetical protein, conserved [Eimeria necatrix]CDJ66465.1 hypothetical protein, conserved [Eimeria necatrix]
MNCRVTAPSAQEIAVLNTRVMSGGRQRWQAGSIVTTVTDLPVASDVTDTKSGGFGHVNVVLPRPSRVHRSDRIIEQLNKGMDPAETLYGGLGVEGRTDLRFPLSAV